MIEHSFFENGFVFETASRRALHGSSKSIFSKAKSDSKKYPIISTVLCRRIYFICSLLIRNQKRFQLNRRIFSLCCKLYLRRTSRVASDPRGNERVKYTQTQIASSNVDAVKYLRKEWLTTNGAPGSMQLSTSRCLNTLYFFPPLILRQMITGHCDGRFNYEKTCPG